ncbi:MAG: hypothetical protein A2X25_10165 [Chloroflexi bacterium GWB2_49_20]|nr:MAG: hypothetical protein A2X25_10165 [Chloroflexi bacterium GWB2_49_20]OGN79218.1 MAG: hypothetical protein A2X26_03855 [Chloroflexi bacterium GWC2_49_37]OGN83012.1 MAG: hypothetical protein A2X27_08840 [Chloroflexi bacterium GWD2_49_16]HCC78672.1 hypothetical protein [Anaerolineae bacterium]
MSNTGDSISGLLRDVGENLGSIFRYFFPGVLIVGAAYLAYPSIDIWKEIKLDNPWHFLALGIVTVVIGNTWFVFNRFGIHQLIDYILYLFNFDGPARNNPILDTRSYVKSLGRFIVESNMISNEMKSVRKHVGFRASSILLMYTFGELAVLFSIKNAGAGTFFFEHTCFTIFIGVIAIMIGIWQNIITRSIDWFSVYPPKPEDKTNSAKQKFNKTSD